MNKSNTIPLLVFIILVIVDLVCSLRCYECGVFVQTSVTRCQNLTREHLKECPHEYCSKYVGLSAVVYGCESKCTERSHGSFESYCCQEDRCNAAPPSQLQAIPFVSILTKAIDIQAMAATVSRVLTSLLMTTTISTSTVAAIMTTFISASSYSLSLLFVISCANNFLLH